MGFEGLLIGGVIEIIRAIKEMVAAGQIKPEDIAALETHMDELRAASQKVKDEWDSLAPD